MERAALYSAAMGVREIAKFTIQKADPLAIASMNAFLQIFWFGSSFSSPYNYFGTPGISVVVIERGRSPRSITTTLIPNESFFLFLYAFNQEPKRE